MRDVGLVFDDRTGTLHKHGDPNMVAKWHKNAAEKFKSAGFDEMAHSLVMIMGRFPLDELNKCLDISDYAGRFYQKVLAGEIVALSFDESVESGPDHYL